MYKLKPQPMIADCMSEKIVIMRRQGYSYDDIAEKLKTTPGNARQLHYKRMRKRSRPLAGDYGKAPTTPVA